MASCCNSDRSRSSTELVSLVVRNAHTRGNSPPQDITYECSNIPNILLTVLHIVKITFAQRDEYVAYFAHGYPSFK